MAELLMERGANLTIEDNNGKTACYFDAFEIIHSIVDELWNSNQQLWTLHDTFVQENMASTTFEHFYKCKCVHCDLLAIEKTKRRNRIRISEA